MSKPANRSPRPEGPNQKTADNDLGCLLVCDMTRVPPARPPVSLHPKILKSGQPIPPLVAWMRLLTQPYPVSILQFELFIFHFLSPSISLRKHTVGSFSS